MAVHDMIEEHIILPNRYTYWIQDSTDEVITILCNTEICHNTGYTADLGVKMEKILELSREDFT